MASLHWISRLCFVGLLYSLAVRADDHTSCYNNITKCEADLTALLADTDTFWFGSGFKAACPESSSSIFASTPQECINSGPDRMSIWSRLVQNNTDVDPMMTQKVKDVGLVNVTYNAPEGEYYACRHFFQVPALTNHVLDPFHVTLVSSWSLDHTPTVTWPAADGELYTVLVWDVGYYFLHGLYINCVNGRMDTGEEIDAYHGPQNGMLRENVFVFAVYRQSSRLDMMQVTLDVGNNVASNNYQFIPMQFFQQNAPSFMNVLRVVADPLSVKLASDFGGMNNCPLLVSQMSAFHKVVSASNLSVSWSSGNMMSVMSDRPHLTSLTVDLYVEYSTDDYVTESCCNIYSLTRGKFMPDPFNGDTERPGMARNKPLVRMSAVQSSDQLAVKNSMYTLFCLDVASAQTDGAGQNGRVNYITHWAVTNIRDAEVSTGDEVGEYFGPNPFTPDMARPYMFLLIKHPMGQRYQPVSVDSSALSQLCPSGVQRCRLDLFEAVQALGLLDSKGVVNIAGLNWFLAEQDGFARMRIYDVLKARSKFETCVGVPGFTDPCPAKCTNSAPYIRSPGAVALSTLSLVAMLYYFV